MTILILGAAGEISRLVTERILAERQDEIILYARNASKRLTITNPLREKVIDGDFNNRKLLVQAMEGADLIYLNDMSSPEAVQNIVKAMKTAGVSRIIGVTILGISDEVIGKFGHWYGRMAGKTGIDRHKAATAIIEQSGINYTLLHLTWLYSQPNNERYVLTHRGEAFIGAQVAREAVARLILTILAEPKKYSRKSVGVSGPDTDWRKSSFYQMK